MPGPCPVAGIVAGFEFTAWRGAPFVDAAGHLFSDLAGEGGTTQRHMVGATHAAGAAIHLHRQSGRHLASGLIKLID